MSKYEENKAAKVGSTIICPTCGKEFVKKQYSQAFCCLQCKDKYWNTMGDRHKGTNEAFKKQQPEVDLEKEIDTYFQGWTDCDDYSQALNAEGECVSTDEIIEIARHFYKLGLNSRKEGYGNPATAVGKVFTNTDPKLLTVDSDEWQSVLGQFDNGQRVRVILVKEDAE